MISTQQSVKIQRRILQIADEVRGEIDWWSFKTFGLGILFNQFISKNFALKVSAVCVLIHYAELPDTVISADFIRSSWWVQYFVALDIPITVQGT